jgi:hypothetical protein
MSTSFADFKTLTAENRRERATGDFRRLVNAYAERGELNPEEFATLAGAQAELNLTDRDVEASRKAVIDVAQLERELGAASAVDLAVLEAEIVRRRVAVYENLMTSVDEIFRLGVDRAEEVARRLRVAIERGLGADQNAERTRVLGLQTMAIQAGARMPPMPEFISWPMPTADTFALMRKAEDALEAAKSAPRELRDKIRQKKDQYTLVFAEE